MEISDEKREELYDLFEEVFTKEEAEENPIAQTAYRSYRLGFLETLKILGISDERFDVEPTYKRPRPETMDEGTARSLFFNMPRRGAADELAERAIRRPEGKPGGMERFVMWLMGR